VVTAVVVPVLNEDWADLATLTRELEQELALLVIVVDDSPQHTPLLYGRGLTGVGSLGGSLEEGMAEALELGADTVAVIDAGGSHDVDDLVHLLAHADEADIIIGSRFVPGAMHLGSPRRRRQSRWYGRLMSVATGNGIRDWTSGMRVYSRDAVEAILAAEPDSLGHVWQAEVLLHALNAGCTVQELPITYMPSTSSLDARARREAVRFLGRLVWA
jgi:dolichol-phosphate mannosyltransferase